VCLTEASASEPKDGKHRRRDLKRWAIEVFLEVSYDPKKEPAMTHPDECPAIDDLTALLIEPGPAAMASDCPTIGVHPTPRSGGKALKRASPRLRGAKN